MVVAYFATIAADGRTYHVEYYNLDVIISVGYYDALGKSDRESDSGAFVVFMVEIILDTLRETTVVGNADGTINKTNPSVQKLLGVLGEEELSAAQIMERLDLSHRPTFRKNYLNPALAQEVIEMTVPDKPNSRNQMYRRK